MAGNYAPTFKFTPLNATLETVSAHLYADERIVLSQDGLGLYDGKEKDPKREDGRLFLTSHRLIYIDALRPHLSSISLPLSQVRQTEYWTGFLKSSAKITLLLRQTGAPAANANGAGDGSRGAVEDLGDRNWVCRVCGMNNASGGKCALCGVSREAGASSVPSSLPGSRSNTPAPGNAGRQTPSPSPATSTPTTGADKRIACAACTFLNHHSMGSCEVCGSPLPTPINTSSTPRRTSRPPIPGSTPMPSSSDTAPFVRLSFRRGGEKVFYSELKLALETKEWESDRGGKSGKSKGTNEASGGGIDAILRGIDLDARERESTMEDALRDLDALMMNAKEMITLAKSLNERLSVQESQSTTTNPSESDTKLIRNSLAHLGLTDVAVTSDVIKDNQQYHEALAKELAGVLGRKGGIMKDGLVGLDEVWCVWNRARGVALVSPTDLRLAAPYLTQHSKPRIYLRTFQSGLTVLHTSQFAQGSFTARLLDLLDLRQALAESFSTAFDVERTSAEREGATTLEIAREEKLGLTLTKEMLEGVEGFGDIVRDEQGDQGVRFYRNYISSSSEVM